jgi:hypothetical protein
MLKKTITFEDFNGDTVSETHYFNLTKSELIELETSYDGGLEATMQALVEAKSGKDIIENFTKIILSSYGQKSPDGKRFVKNDALREDFKQTAAFDALFMELVTDSDAGAMFIKGVLPSDLAAEIDKDELKKKTAEAIGVAPSDTPPSA